MTPESCTRFIRDYDEEAWSPCRCPKCNGFLPRDFPLGSQFQCRRCGAVLETLPSKLEEPEEEEDTDYEWGGRICLVPPDCIIIEVQALPMKPRYNRKTKTKKWAMGDGFSRRVWRDRDGEFIEIGPERIPITDPRIILFSEIYNGEILGRWKNEV